VKELKNQGVYSSKWEGTRGTVYWNGRKKICILITVKKKIDFIYA